jgi:hypothetical protein
MNLPLDNFSDHIIAKVVAFLRFLRLNPQVPFVVIGDPKKPSEAAHAALIAHRVGYLRLTRGKFESVPVLFIERKEK